MLRTGQAGSHRIPSVINATIVLAQLALMGLCLWGAGRVHGWWAIAGVAVGFGVLMNSVYSIIHEAEHRMLFKSAFLNDAVGVLMTLFFPAPFHLLRQGHLGHHMRNRSDDEAFDLYFENENPLWRRLQMYGILTGCYWLVVVIANPLIVIYPGILQRKHFEFERQSAAFMESLNPRYMRWIWLEALAVCLLHAGIILLLHIPVLTYFIVYFTFGFMWSAMQYVHHYGTERHVTKGARNLFLWGPLDLLWLNHNWHQTHHEHPTVPWPHLPRIGKEETPKRGFLIRAWLRMWCGPRLSKDHVENKYAGRVIR